VLALIRQIYEYREPSKRIRLAMAARDPRQALGEGETWVHSWFWGQQFVEATSELLLGHTKLESTVRYLGTSLSCGINDRSQTCRKIESIRNNCSRFSDPIFLNASITGTSLTVPLIFSFAMSFLH
jgi:hypothetical protein